MNCRYQILNTMLLLALVAGCGDSGLNRVSVQGSVTLDGQPLPEGIITFVSQSGGPTAAATITNGDYDFDALNGPSPGKQQVQIVAFRENATPGQKAQPVRSGTASPQEASPNGSGVGAADMPNQQQYIPARYNTESELTVELLNGHNADVSFGLKLDKSRP